MDRKDLGSWLEGPPIAAGYEAGQDFGFPVEGPGSIATFGRRVMSLVIDWGLCLGLSYLLFDYSALATSVLFIAMNVTMHSLFGATVGQFAMGLRVLPVRGRMPMVIRALIRIALMHAIIPAMVWDKDRRPLHDVAAGTAVIRA